MESYGELLRTTRESKQLDLDRASREISIEKRYLAGLEEEDIIATSAENNALDVSEISKMLDSLDVTAFAKFIPHAA